MTLREIWLTLTGHPEKASANGVPLTADDSRLEALDWWTTDSPSQLRERAERVGAEKSNR